MIPKIIHYCWFGRGEMPKLAKTCIESWGKYLPDYALKLWNEDNFDVSTNSYTKEAYKAKKYAFVTDYVRLFALYGEGGIYMDTDVEVLKSMDDLLHLPGFSGFESKKEAPTGIMACERGNTWAKEQIDYYTDRHFLKPDGSLDTTTNVQTITKRMFEGGLLLNNTQQLYKGCMHIFPKEYFCPKERSGKLNLTENSYCIHHFASSWQSPYYKFKKLLFKKILGVRITSLLIKIKWSVFGFFGVKEESLKAGEALSDEDNKYIKAAFLLGSLNRGGLETLMLDTLTQIKGSGIEAICIYRNEGILLEEFSTRGIKTISLKPGFKVDIKYLLKLRRTLRKNGIAIAHAQQPIDALYAYLACLGLRTKVVLTYHGFEYNSTNTAKWIFNFMYKRTALNIFVSQTQRDYYLKKFRFKESNTRVLYNGISIEKFHSIENKSIRKEFHIPEDHLLLGSVGNFNHVRDQMTICRFLTLLKKEGIPFSFIFVGTLAEKTPQYWDNCIQYCQEYGLSDAVHFIGSRKDVPNILSQLDAFVYSTAFDTFGIAIIEALFAGLSVFVNDWEVFREITEDGNRVIMYKTKDEEDLLIKVKGFLIERKKYKAKAMEDAEWAKQKYSIQNHIKNLEKIYFDVL